MGGRILVVDDEGAIRRLLRNTLQQAGHEVIEAVNGRDALARAAEDAPDAVLLDLGLPDRDGLGLLPILVRDGGPSVLVVSAREATAEKVAALDLGAADYLVKPFDTEELLARLRAALRGRNAVVTGAVVKVADLEIDVERRRVRRNGENVHLTRKEYDVLATLAASLDRVITHDRLIAAAWKPHEDPRIEYLRIVVRNLRQKLEVPASIGSLISNELGVGYRLRSER